jgi:hypothetical protein
MGLKARMGGLSRSLSSFEYLFKSADVVSKRH